MNYVNYILLTGVVITRIGHYISFLGFNVFINKHIFYIRHT